MKILIAEDDPGSNRLLSSMLYQYGECLSVNNGLSAVETVSQALIDKKPFNLIMLDIMMPKLDGHACLKKIRELEKEHKVEKSASAKIIMITALSDKKNVLEAFKGSSNAYIVKPVIKEKIEKELKKLNLIG